MPALILVKQVVYEVHAEVETVLLCSQAPCIIAMGSLEAIYDISEGEEDHMMSAPHSIWASPCPCTLLIERGNCIEGQRTTNNVRWETEAVLEREGRKGDAPI